MSVSPLRRVVASRFLLLTFGLALPGLAHAQRAALSGRILDSAGDMTMISTRSLNPASIRETTNIKPCGIQVWQDGSLLSDPNASMDLAMPGKGTGTPDREVYPTKKIGADHDYDVSNLLANDYM